MDNFRLGRHTKFLLMFTYEAAALAWETTRKKILPCHQTICSGSSIIHGLHNNEGRLRHWTTDKYSNPTANHFSLKDIKCQCYDTCPQRFDIQWWDDNHFNYKLERLTAEWAIKMHFSNIFDTMWEIERDSGHELVMRSKQPKRTSISWCDNIDTPMSTQYVPLNAMSFLFSIRIYIKIFIDQSSRRFRKNN